jgi:hypothetical protein
MFDLKVLQGWPVGGIVRVLRVNPAQVYLAEHRVQAALRREILRLVEEHATPLGEYLSVPP